MKFNELTDMMQKPEPKPDTYEAGMALNQLLKIGTHAIKIHNMIDDGAEMEAWVAKKIDLASNYVKSVHGYTAGSKAGTYDDGGMTENANNYVEEYDWKCEKCGHTNTFGMTQKDVAEYIRSWEEDNPEIVASGEDTGEGALDWQMNVIKDQSGMHQGQACANCGTIAESIKEDAGEGHMSKSQLYQTAKMAIELLDMIKKGDDLEGWVQTKLNLAADYLQAVYHYEDYQKLNPYREEIDSTLMQKHAGIIQKHLDEILAKETKARDVDTKPGMMRILKKRVNEVEKEIAKEQRSNEEAPPGREKQVKKLKGKFKDKGAPYAIAWAQHNKHGKPKKEAELEEGKIKDWAKNLAMAGIFVAGLAGVGSINDAINNSVPAIKAMNNALEIAKDQNNDELVAQIEKDIKGAKLRLDIGKDLNQVKYLQDKYSEFMPTEGLAYESKLAIMLNQHIK